MPQFLSPVGNDQFIDANGDPLTGGRVETYLAGSSTPAATYTSSAGVTPQANPIILNSLGYAPSPIWLTGGVAYKFIIKDSSGSTLRTIDDISGVNDASVSQSEWVESGLVPTFISATSFSVPGDQTPLLQIGRRLRTTNTSGLVYSTIRNSTFAAGITTVTLLNDSTTLDVGLSLVAYSLLSASNSSVPPYPPNRVIDRAYVEYTTNANLTAVIPLDDTIPQNTEGTQILSVSFTPKATTNRLRFRFQGQFSINVLSNGIAAVFSSASANALRSVAKSVTADGYNEPFILEYEYVPATTSALTFSVRVGPVSGTMRMNGSASGRLLGGSQGATLVIEEIAA